MLLVIIFIACKNDKAKEHNTNTQTNGPIIYDDPSSHSSNSYKHGSSEDFEDEEVEDEELVEDDIDNSSDNLAIKKGKLKEDTYSATVEYTNPKTGYSNTYTLDVDIEDNEVTVIHFPNDGYLDEDHITPAELDEDGHVEIEGEDGKTYDIQIDL
ncbi:hypothetical protein [Segetibacter koreensis]|uniref:hypothetical protein n=1 Tax=Segetibacter koreensis TaxID=398037 RepID=UPI0003A3E698|nr:hypothetical protein [Segetibacter koreensis]